MRSIVRKSVSVILVLAMLFTMAFEMTAFAADFAENTSGQSTLTATATLQIGATTANGLTDTCAITVNAAATDKVYTVFKVNQIRTYNFYFGALVKYDAKTREVMLSVETFKAKLMIDSTDISFYTADGTPIGSSAIEADDQVPTQAELQSMVQTANACI